MDKIFLSPDDARDFKNSFKDIKSEHVSSFSGVEIFVNRFLPKGTIVVCGASISDREKFSYIPGMSQYSIVMLINIGT